MKLSRDWRVYAVGGAAALGVVALFVHISGPAASGVAPPELPSFDGEWVEIPAADSVRLVKGTRYRACIRLGFLNPVRALATVDRIRTSLEGAGFTGVRVASGDTPPNWPAGVDCFRYVDATWSQADKDFDRPGAVELGWRWVPKATT
ncbi:MAG: hypothetical protein JWL95_3241 [Gemmatimonadetes bacterium]|nr:hypothetical protein [Gemmatimonadota bacterium]